MTAPFTPKADVAEWRLIYDVLSGRDVGDVVTHQEMSDALGRSFAANRSPFYKAARVWGEKNLRALVPVPGQGYRVVEAIEHEDIARRHHKRSRRALGRSRFAIRTVDRSRLDPENLRRFDNMEINISRQQDMLRRLEARQTKTETRIAEQTADHEQTKARLARLEEALRSRGFSFEA